MAAPKHNQFWRNRTEHGREKLFATPELLQEAIHQYFNWVDGHPWYRNEAVKSGDLAGTIVKIPVARPYTLTGLCIYLGASENWWKEFRKNDNLSKDFLAIITRTEEIIRTQKFEGAAVGAFNANIIARDLGMVDKGEMGFRDKDGNPTDPPKQVMIIGGKEIEF